MKQGFKTGFVLAFAMLLNKGIHAQFKITGTVKDETGHPIPFVPVGILQTQHTSVTSIQGDFTITGVEQGTVVLNTYAPGYSMTRDTLMVRGDISFNPVLRESGKNLDEVVVNATRVDNSNGMVYNNIDSETLKKQNLGQDAPYMLAQLPSVVVNSDAGNGVGYTGLRIRGTDATRVNVTINGVPVNDAESQGTYFVDMPDLVSSVNNIQVQRGVGASSNGAGAFGATINFQTNQLNEKSYAKAISTAGSYNTFRNTLAAGTGLLNNHFTLDARASNITSNGYIDRASSKLQSYYLAAGWYGKKAVWKLINFMGQEKTYQAWNYVLEDSIKNGNRTFNSCGQIFDANGNFTGKYYKNETDNYKQNNFQLHFIHSFNSRTQLNVTAHYTKGAGYYEQYRSGNSLADYGLPPVITAKHDTITNTDLIRRLWLDNDFAGGIFNFNYKATANFGFTLGGGYNTYFGKHFNRIIWAQYPSTSTYDYQYNLNTANKNDGNIYLKMNYRPVKNLNVFADMQVRHVDYRFLGFTDSLKSKMQNQTYTFMNPKLGLSYDVKRLNLYASVAMANKEPNRDDFVQSSPQSRPKPETLTDIETGARYSSRKLNMAINFYDMEYKNQLVLNGQINNVGAYNRVNVSKSFRRGIEIEAAWSPIKQMAFACNLTLSQNKIANFNEYIDSSDVDYTIYTQYKVVHKNTDISFSPSLIASGTLVYKPAKGLELNFISKFVGRQYLDNTSNTSRSISPYQVFDLRANYHITTKFIPEIDLMFGVYNLLSSKYVTNGYTYSYYAGPGLTTGNYLAPAAPRNFLGGVALKF